jgi:hypothetical protein
MKALIGGQAATAELKTEFFNGIYAAASSKTISITFLPNRRSKTRILSFVRDVT